jgi:hypothetical protein
MTTSPSPRKSNLLLVVAIVLVIGLALGVALSSYFAGASSSSTSLQPNQPVKVSGIINAYGYPVQSILFQSRTGQQISVNSISGGSYSVNLLNGNWYIIYVYYGAPITQLTSCSTVTTRASTTTSGNQLNCSTITTTTTEMCQVPTLLVNVTSSSMTDDITCR